jgi:hypothetical protein
MNDDTGLNHTGPHSTGQNDSGHDTSLDEIDAALLDELRLVIAQADPPPPRLIETAKAAYVWRTIDEELAHLEFDSLAGSDVLVRSGGSSGVHLSFATPEASIEVEVTDGGLVGQVVPPATEVCLLLGSGQRIETACDELGQFTFERQSSGPVRLVARLAGGDVVTEWFTI